MDFAFCFCVVGRGVAGWRGQRENGDILIFGKVNGNLIGGGLAQLSLPFVITVGTKLAGGAMAAAISPIIFRVVIAKIAGVRLGANKFCQNTSPQFLSQQPGFCFRQVHERCFYRQWPVHPERECGREGLQRLVAAIGVA